MLVVRTSTYCRYIIFKIYSENIVGTIFLSLWWGGKERSEVVAREGRG